MTAQRARHSHARHYRAAPARTVPAHLAHLHPDWLPPGGYAPDGTYLDPADDRDAPILAETPARDPSRAPIPFPGAPTASQTELPAAFNSTAGSSTTQLTLGDDPRNAIAGRAATDPARDEMPTSAYAHPWRPGSSFPPPDPDHPEDEDAIFHDPYLPGGRETQLSYTALPLRHRIYALHCQGRSISAIARSLRLDRGTVARHLHAVEDLLLAEQTEDLARLRLRAVEAQHAVLAAAWDALLCEELNESDASNEQPYPARRAQLLATAARAARTAAQLQGLFTPAALAAALPSVGGAGATPADPAASRGMLASAAAAPSPTPEALELAAGLQPAFRPTTTTEPAADACPLDPAANCGMPASAPAGDCPTGLPRACNCGARDTGLPVVRRQGHADRT